MENEGWPTIPPRRILLATDLSSRSDRALDRATQLALTWDAELLIVHALEETGLMAPQSRGLPSWRRPPDNSTDIELQIREDIRGDCPRLRVLVEEGESLKVILNAIEREHCDLVVLGLGRQRLLNWAGIGKTVEELVRRAPVSVLVVKRRPNGPYQHVLVGTDLTSESRTGLEVAGQMFPGAKLALMHAFDMPYAYLMNDTQLGRDFGAMERSEIRSFVEKAALPEELRARLITFVEHGPPDAMLGAYVVEQKADLVVIGAYERGLLFHMTLRGNGPKIVEAVPSDVLVVRAQADPGTFVS